MNLRKNDGKAKKIIIIIIAVLLIMIGIFAYLLFGTDIFKSDEELFWKYISKNTEIIEIFNMPNDERYNNKSYISYNEITFDCVENELSNLNLAKLSIGIKNDEQNKKMQSLINLEYDNQDLFNMEILNNGNYYAIKNDELANGYIVIKNENLKSIIENIGGNPENIPNQINTEKYKEVFKISEEDKKHIQEKYYQVIQENIDDSKYSKRKKVQIIINDQSYKVNEYRLTLTESEFYNLLISALEELKTDSITLNLIATKLKNINPDSKYTNINELNKEISAIIKQLKEKNVSKEEYLIITVYEQNGKTVGTNIEIKNKDIYTISFNKEQGEVCINRECQQEFTDTWKKINIKNTYSNEQEEFLFEVIYNEDWKKISIEMKKEKSAESYKLLANIRIFENSITLNGDVIITNVEELPDIQQASYVVINELDAEKQKVLIQKLRERMLTILEDKKQIIKPM